MIGLDDDWVRIISQDQSVDLCVALAVMAWSVRRRGSDARYLGVDELILGVVDETVNRQKASPTLIQNTYLVYMRLEQALAKYDNLSILESDYELLHGMAIIRLKTAGDEHDRVSIPAPCFTPRRGLFHPPHH